MTFVVTTLHVTTLNISVKKETLSLAILDVHAQSR
jgi:hypothetical protein